MQDDYGSEDVKKAILDIAYQWIGQTSDNTATKREERLPRYHLTYSYQYGFYYELKLWMGTTIGIYWPSHQVNEDHEEDSVPIHKNAGGRSFVSTLTVSGTHAIIERQTEYLITIFDNLNIFSIKHQGFEIEIETLEDVLKSLQGFKQGLKKIE